MNDEITEAWGSVVHILNVSHTDINKSQVMKSGFLLNDFLRLINVKLRKAGSNKSIQVLEAILPAYPVLILRSVDYSRNDIDTTIVRRKGSYEPSSIPYEFIISQEDPAPIDVISALKTMAPEGLDISGMNVLYADSGESLQLMIFLDITRYRNTDAMINSDNTTQAKLAMRGFSQPIVTIGQKSYTFTSMRAGNALKIIQHCLEEHPDKSVKLAQLKTEINIKGVKNLKQSLRGTRFETGKGVLSPFVVVSPDEVLVKSTTHLTDSELRSVNQSENLAKT